jgi:protein-ribulosamine 3-kinase
MFDDPNFYEHVLLSGSGEEAGLDEHRLIAAGNINQGVYLRSKKGSEYFLKLNFQPELSDIFEKEANGLQLMADNTPLKVPKVSHFGKLGERNFLLMEWIPGGYPSQTYWEDLGTGLAQMHMATRNAFGLDTTNYIASLPQNNTSTLDWAGFFIRKRLDVLIGKAYYENLIDKSFLKTFQSIYPKLEDDFFPKEKPALIHGDLWSGNVITDKGGSPVLIDPAIYYGHREMDLAFSQLFGGFDDTFYRSYEAVFPLEPEFDRRIPVYNLYPLLVHVLLFGRSYLPAVQKTVKSLL